MIHLTFSPEQLETLKYERFHHPHPMVQRKCEALLLQANGLSTSKIGSILSLTPNTIRNYYEEFSSGGLEKIKSLSYKGQPSELRNHQESLENSFSADPPTSVAEAQDRIERLTGIHRSPAQVREFLRRSGFRFRKVAPVPGKANPEIQEEFKKNTSNHAWKRHKRGNGWFSS